MNPTTIVIAVVLVVVVAVVFGPTIAGAWERYANTARCRDLEAQLRAMRVQGGDNNAIARLQSELYACYAAAKASGADVDLGLLHAEDCALIETQIGREWEHYKSTAGEDAIARNNIRQQILRLGGEMVACYRAAVPMLSTSAGAARMKQLVANSIALTRERSKCFREGQAGCSRYGLNEPSGDERDTDEAQRVWLPLKAVLAQVDARILQLRADERRAKAPAVEAARKRREAARGGPATEEQKEAVGDLFRALFDRPRNNVEAPT